MTQLRIAVTGAGGFIGRHVLAELATCCAEVIAVTRDAAKLSDHGGNVSVVEMDIADAQVNAYERLHKPDVLIHLAWDGLPNYGSLHHFETELPRQYAFLKGLIAAGLPALLMSGTCAEYGLQSGALSEELTPSPHNPYGHAKDALRRELQFLRHAHPFALTWARLFYMYGEGQWKGSLYSQVKEAVLRGDRSFDMSGGEQLRDFMPVAEVARMIVLLALVHCDVGVINVCAGKPVTIRNLVEGWIRENNWDIELNLGKYPYPDYEVMEFWGDRRRLDELIRERN